MSRTATGLRERLAPERRVREGSVSLYPNDGSVKATINKEVVRKSGRDPTAPGRASWYYLPSDGLLILDLGGEYSTATEGE